MKTICYIGPKIGDAMDQMIRDGFTQLCEKWQGIHFFSDQSMPRFYKTCKRADLVLICTNRGTNWRMMRDIAKVHNRWAILDGSDYVNWKGIRLLSVENAPLIFKREYRPDTHGQMPNVVPCSFSVMSDWAHPGRIVKFLNFSFAGKIYPYRRPFVNAAKAVNDPFSILCGGGLNPGQYWSMLDASKIGISLGGAGWDCVRTWEIVSRRDCLLAMQDPNGVKMSEPAFVDGVHCILFNRPRELMEKLAYYTKHEDLRRRIARAGRAFAFEHHTSELRAKSILRIAMNRFRDLPQTPMAAAVELATQAADMEDTVEETIQVDTAAEQIVTS